MAKQEYFFILGRTPVLSLAEILSVLSLKNLKTEITLVSAEVAVLSIEGEFDASSLINQLGGTVKVGKVIQSADIESEEKSFWDIFSSGNLLRHYLPEREGKMHIGISIYDGGAEKIYRDNLEKILKELNVTVKENLGNAGKKAGFVQIKERYLSSVSVAKNELLKKGAEIVLIASPGKISAGKTLAVQEFGSFSFRDFYRPMKDKRSGIMPPKLARMMINLSSANPEGRFLDPFCGSGTVLSEAAMLGIKNIIGTDISEKAVSDSQKNLDWLFANFRKLTRDNFKIEIYQNDIRTLSGKIPPHTVDTVVTEPYLGPPLFKKPDFNAVRNIFSQLQPLYLQAFEELAKILKPGGSLIIIFPAFEENGNFRFMEILSRIKSLGFEKQEFFPENVQRRFSINLTPRGTILYGGKDQFVYREILRFKKV